MDIDAAKNVQKNRKCFPECKDLYIGNLVLVAPCSAKQICQLPDCRQFHNLKQTNCFDIDILKAAHLSPLTFWAAAVLQGLHGR